MADLQELAAGITLGSVLAFFLALGAVTLAAYFCYKAVKAVLMRCTSPSSARWVARFAGYFVFAVLIYAVDILVLGIDLNATLASLGILSIALAFASQQIISNLLAGFLTTINRTIRLDDWVEIGGSPETGIAQVKDMTFTRTVLQDRDGRVFLIPNATLLSSKIVNYSKSGLIEISVPVSLPLSIPFSEAESVILKILANHPTILQAGSDKSPARTKRIGTSYFFQGYTGNKGIPTSLSPRVLLTGITHQAVQISIRFWIGDATRQEEIISGVLARVEKELNLPSRE